MFSGQLWVYSVHRLCAAVHLVVFNCFRGGGGSGSGGDLESDPENQPKTSRKQNVWWWWFGIESGVASVCSVFPHLTLSAARNAGFTIGRSGVLRSPSISPLATQYGHTLCLGVGRCSKQFVGCIKAPRVLHRSSKLYLFFCRMVCQYRFGNASSTKSG